MQATDFANRDDHAALRRLDRASAGCILVEREVSASPVIVLEVRAQDASQVPLAENDDMVQTLPPDRAESRSANGFCHGLCGAVRTSSICMPFTRCRNCAP